MKPILFLSIALTVLTADLVSQTDHHRTDANKVMTKIGPLASFSVEALDGKTTIVGSQGFAFVDADFVAWGLNRPGQKTKKTDLTFYLPPKDDSTFCRLFNGPDTLLEKMALTQHQIVRFCEKYPEQLREYADFFIFKNGKEYFITIVYKDGKDVIAIVRRTLFASIWFGSQPRRLVIPQRP
jgi:hypothetical protein